MFIRAHERASTWTTGRAHAPSWPRCRHPLSAKWVIWLTALPTIRTPASLFSIPWVSASINRLHTSLWIYQNWNGYIFFVLLLAGMATEDGAVAEAVLQLHQQSQNWTQIKHRQVDTNIEILLIFFLIINRTKMVKYPNHTHHTSHISCCYIL